MKHRIGSFSEITPKPGAKVLEAVDFYQSSCWHCKDVWIDGRNPIKVERGMICPTCKRLNEYL